MTEPEEIKQGIEKEIKRIDKLMSSLGSLGRTKLYVKDSKCEEKFFKFIDGSIERIEKQVKDLRNLKEDIEFEMLSS